MTSSIEELEMAETLAVLGFALLGGYLYRWGGGAPPHAPRWVDLLVWALPLAALAWWAAGWWQAGVVLVGCAVARSMGHGSYMDLGRCMDYLGDLERCKDDETPRPLLDLIFGPDPGDSFKRDATGLALTGLLKTLPLVVVWWPVAFVGLAKLPAYLIGWGAWDVLGKGWGPPQLKVGTEWGEALTGVFIYGGCLALVLVQ